MYLKNLKTKNKKNENKDNNTEIEVSDLEQYIQYSHVYFRQTNICFIVCFSLLVILYATQFIKANMHADEYARLSFKFNELV